MRKPENNMCAELVSMAENQKRFSKHDRLICMAFVNMFGCRTLRNLI